MRTAPRIELSPRERAYLRRWSSSARASARLEGRAKIVLEAAEGRRNSEIAVDVGVHPGTVARWRTRFLIGRVAGVRREAPRAGDPRRVSHELVERILRATLHDRSPDGAPWTTRSLARSLKINHMLVHRVWTSYRLSRTSRGPPATSRSGPPLVDLAGLFVSRSVGAVVFASRRRRAANSAQRTVPTLSPNITGRAEFDDPQDAATEVGSIVRQSEEKWRRGGPRAASPASLLVFLRTVEQSAPRSARLEVLLDRTLAESDRRTRDWLAVHTRFHVYTTPAGEPWDRTVATWLSRWGTGSFHRDSLRGVSACRAALAEALGPRGGVAASWAWIYPHARSRV